MAPGMEKTNKALFDSAISIELDAGRIYKDFERYFSHESEISAFWAGLSDDESNHAEILRDTRDSIPLDILETEAKPAMWENISSVSQLLEKNINAVIETLDDAYELAHQIEASEVGAIFKFLTLEFFSSPVREAFITSEIMDHQGKLVSFTKRFGPRSWRKEILAVKR